MLARTSRLLVAVATFLFGACGNDNPRHDPAACPPDPSGESAAIQLSAGSLCGTLQMPAGTGPHPVALIVAGSGPTDRNGNDVFGIRTDAYRELAEALALRGIASLRYDKRGVGASAPVVEADLRPEDGVDDVAAWLTQLKADPRFTNVLLVGHSEGSLLGMLAMQRVPAAAFVSLAGPGRRMVQVFRDQLGRQLQGALLERANRILDQLDAGEIATDVPAQLSYAFRPSVQPYLIALLRYEAARELANLTVPTLIAQGTTDVQVTVADARSLAGARPDAQVLIIDGMCHMLKMASLDGADQTAVLSDPARPLAPALLEGIDAFFRTGAHVSPGK
jgi:pimeloyl-ACP methyl ester carboxylesterase